mmetsp:Transcript_20878/g.45244  ORF Transcript_20878/g.45244 Transcript_20878/m.45244 type:complete len:585 (+) Transcript_20878:103-1857(+)
MQLHEQNQTHSQLRIKCIVLGSAGAGKTSLLRRYIHGTFEGHPGHDELSRSNNRASINRRRGRGTTSTLGADYYVKKVENPLLRGGDSDTASGSNNGSHSRKNRTSHGMDAAESHVLVQLWDTAGKERLKPQKYPAQYDKKSNFYQFLSIRKSSSTNNSNYEHRYNNWGFLNGINDQESSSHHENTVHNNEHKEKVYRHLNTQHKHGHPLHYHRHNGRYSQTNQNPNEPIGDALFRNIDACMLVYDATSSMSFLHLMQWHSEWVQRLNHWEREETEKDRTKIHKAAQDGEKNTGRRKRIPFIVVANKLDLLEEDGEESTKIRSSVGQHRRSVMGFCGGEYGGKELKYEYAAENTKISQSRCQLQQPALATKREGKNYPPTDRLTYSLKETLWSTDATYLNALQLTEDQLPANRLMIINWCQRNEIPHVEASALNGKGVGEAIEHLVKIAVEELEMRKTERSEKRRDQEMIDRESKEQDMPREMTFNGEDTAHPGIGIPESTGFGISTQYMENSNIPKPNSTSDNNNVASGTVSTTSGVDPSQYYFLYQPRQEEKLDLFARYSPKDEQRCSPFKCWPPLVSYCQR